MSHYTSDYWIVNLNTCTYSPIQDTGTFFDGDWKTKTPWPDEKYVNLSAQKIHSDQMFAEHAFYGYDLTVNGMIVGVYYDTTKISKREIQDHVKRLRSQHDVVHVYYHPLTLQEPRNPHKQDIMRLRELQSTIEIINSSSVGSFDKWDIPLELKNALYNYQIMKSRLNDMLKHYGVSAL